MNTLIITDTKKFHDYIDGSFNTPVNVFYYDTEILRQAVEDKRLSRHKCFVDADLIILAPTLGNIVVYRQFKRLLDTYGYNVSIKIQRPHDSLATLKEIAQTIHNANKEQEDYAPEKPASITADQNIKQDANKLPLSTVPSQIIRDIAEVRQYGIAKYGYSESWKQVIAPRYIDAAYRHFLKFVEDPNSIDEESGIKHYKHLACNLAFLSELLKEDK